MKKISPIIIFAFGALVIVFMVYDFASVAHRMPYGMHQWRQCDAYSMALNYAREGLGLFDARMHFQHGVGTGTAVGEFPLTYYLNAQWWGWTSVQPWTMRWTHLWLLLLGLLALFDALRRWITQWPALLTVWFVMVSGLLAFYGSNFIVNTSALALVFVGWWAADHWKNSGLRSTGWLVLMWLALAGAFLFRPTMVMGLIPLLLIPEMAHGRWKWWAAIGSPALIGLLWVGWTKTVNAASRSEYFLTTIRPIWDAQSPGETWRSFREDVLPQWYHKYVLFAILCAVIWLVSTARRSTALEKKLRNGCLCLILALIGYFLLWFENLDVHDYYLIEFQLLTPLVFAWFWSRWQTIQGIHKKRILQWMVVVLLFFQSIESAVRTRMKYGPIGGWASELLLPQRERDLWAWFHWDQERRFGNVRQWEGELRRIGIQRSDLVISVPDPSPNITLSLMDQKGFTNLYDDAHQGDDRIEFYVGKGAQYLVCNDPDWFVAHVDSPWLTRQMTQLGNFRVFDLLNSEANLRLRNKPIDAQ